MHLWVIHGVIFYFATWFTMNGHFSYTTPYNPNMSLFCRFIKSRVIPLSFWADKVAIEMVKEPMTSFPEHFLVHDGMKFWVTNVIFRNVNFMHISPHVSQSDPSSINTKRNCMNSHSNGLSISKKSKNFMRLSANSPGISRLYFIAWMPWPLIATWLTEKKT